MLLGYTAEKITLMHDLRSGTAVIESWIDLIIDIVDNLHLEILSSISNVDLLRKAIDEPFDPRSGARLSTSRQAASKVSSIPTTS